MTLLVDEYVETSTFDRAVKKLCATWYRMMFKCSVVKTKKTSFNKPRVLNQGWACTKHIEGPKKLGEGA